MYDRRRANTWEIVQIDLSSKQGLQLSHYVSEANGGLYTEENTFMGPALDNNYKDAKNVEKNIYILTENFLLTSKKMYHHQRLRTKCTSILKH